MIKLELTPEDLDLIFIALQSAPLPTSFSVVQDLIGRILEQGRPQLLDAAVQEPIDEAA